MAQIEDQTDRVWRCDRPLNLYKTAACTSLVTQAAAGRRLQVLQTDLPAAAAVAVRLCEDDYPGWLPKSDLAALQPAQPYRAASLTRTEIQVRLPQAIAFARAALVVPNQYRWGGTLAPDYDCSGLVQSAFVSAGVWLPRDSYQQEAFAEKIDRSDLQPGDLIFFGLERTTHVALYLGGGNYIHSSGKDQGRNGVGIDSLKDSSHPVSQRYFAQLRSYGRVTRSYCPTGTPMQTRARDSG